VACEAGRVDDSPRVVPGRRQRIQKGIDVTIDADSDHAIGGKSGKWIKVGDAVNRCVERGQVAGRARAERRCPATLMPQPSAGQIGQGYQAPVTAPTPSQMPTRCCGIRYRAACKSVTRRPVVWRFRRSAAVPPKSPRGGRRQVDDGDVVELQRTCESQHSRKVEGGGARRRSVCGHRAASEAHSMRCARIESASC
jgi:hypothetical protein